MKKFIIILMAALMVAGGAQGATIIIINSDSPGEGFNDNTPATPVGGNPGTTIGQQRLNLFQEAADIWGGLLQSNVTIRVQASFDPLNCDATGAVLGAAGPIVLERDWGTEEWSGTWYHAALANKQAGTDLSPFDNDIRARFNSSIDNNNNCLSGTNWYYGFDGNFGGDIALLPVLLHEMAHGLGFSNFVDEASGQEFNGFPDVFSRQILDTSQGLTWDQMSNAQRAISATNDGNLVWNGAGVTGASSYFLGGLPTLFTNSPGTLPATMALGLASFGPQLESAGITGDVVLVDDGSGVTSDGCEALVNGAQVSGNIALIDRGTCTFTSKAQNAEAAGAIAVIIVDNSGGSTPPGLGGTDPGLTIPTVSITTADGALIKAELGGGVNVTLGLDPSVLAGADSQGRVKLYAPDPIQPGSSISHFDVSAFPHLLMEPAINDNLNDEVDLTIQAFDDIGWFSPRVSPAPRVLSTNSMLSANYPNPFNPSTRIDFRVGDAGPVRLVVHDAAGRLVRTLVSESLAASDYSIQWNGEDNAGRRVGSGVYFYRLEAPGFSETRRMVLLK